MHLVPENLTRFRDSYLLLEVWRRSPFAAAGVTRDRLYALCRLPLHPFFISFRDPVISESLLQAEVFKLELMYILMIGYVVALDTRTNVEFIQLRVSSTR